MNQKLKSSISMLLATLVGCGQTPVLRADEGIGASHAAGT